MVLDFLSSDDYEPPPEQSSQCVKSPWEISFEKVKEEGNIFIKTFDDENKNRQNLEAKPRMRICFDPEHEIPKLQAWFAENNHPSRSQVEEYVNILNSLEARKGKKPLDINNVIYWFKNTRAAVKRQQTKHDRKMMDPFYFQKMPHLYENHER